MVLFSADITPVSESKTCSFVNQHAATANIETQCRWKCWSIEGYIDTTGNKILQMFHGGKFKQSQIATPCQIDTAEGFLTWVSKQQRALCSKFATFWQHKNAKMDSEIRWTHLLNTSLSTLSQPSPMQPFIFRALRAWLQTTGLRVASTNLLQSKLIWELHLKW